MIVGLRRASRLLRLLLHILCAIPLGAVAHLLPQPERVSQLWFRGLLNVLRLRVDVQGTLGDQPLLLAGNHISWLDIAVLAASRPLVFVSKAEVGRWPLIGWLARAGDTLFIERGANGTAQLNEQLTAILGDGRTAVIFPEGTTTRGYSVRRFAPRLFASAIATQAPVQPFMLRYREASAPYVDDDTMLGNIWRLLAEPEIQVQLRFGPVLAAGERRDAIARQAQTWVETQLHTPAGWTGQAERINQALPQT